LPARRPFTLVLRIIHTQEKYPEIYKKNVAQREEMQRVLNKIKNQKGDDDQFSGKSLSTSYSLLGWTFAGTTKQSTSLYNREFLFFVRYPRTDILKGGRGEVKRQGIYTDVKDKETPKN
jgi:hypothetical protein